jgi:hypothetical protein
MLFMLDRAEWTVVHLTWRLQEENPFPATSLYPSLAEALADYDA